MLLALDLLLSWMRIPFPLLRQTAWLLTAATIAFNGAASWPDPLGVAMHASIPVLFVITVEAARHAVGRTASIVAGRHMDRIRLARWLLSPWPTFKISRRRVLFELRDYDDVIRLEQDRLIYKARLEVRYGRKWRRKAPLEARLPLKFAKYGLPLNTAAGSLPSLSVERALPLRPVPQASSREASSVWQEPCGKQSTGGRDEQDHTTADSTDSHPSGSQEDLADKHSTPTGTGSPEGREPREPAPRTAVAGDGRAAVQAAYDLLPDADRFKSARLVAQVLSPRLGLKENTVRVYVNDLRRDRRTVPSQQEVRDLASGLPHGGSS